MDGLTARRAMVKVIAFDVNETLLDLDAMVPAPCVEFDARRKT